MVSKAVDSACRKKLGVVEVNVGVAGRRVDSVVEEAVGRLSLELFSTP